MILWLIATTKYSDTHWSHSQSIPWGQVLVLAAHKTALAALPLIAHHDHRSQIKAAHTSQAVYSSPCLATWALGVAAQMAEVGVGVRLARLGQTLVMHGAPQIRRWVPGIMFLVVGVRILTR
jgi:hypothetical protein